MSIQKDLGIIIVTCRIGETVGNTVGLNDVLEIFIDITKHIPELSLAWPCLVVG